MSSSTESTKSIIFVHADIDLYGLGPYEFRLYAHIGRRGKCYSSLDTIAKICKMSVRRAQSGLKELEKLGLIEKEVRKGRTDIYQLAPRSNWKRPEKSQDLDEERKKVQEKLSQNDINNEQKS
ncbi:helix-turn-helix domain-containing protein [Cyanothece sp. BG0011]|uniref:helix-turn-helix domain-containing protein n=1 Tax=Cyanothece sp. BG0011 TaxID=2082950 RepID=UPI000D1F65D7|nr:helix-turn-helix domain-containing protein [Cyanothece sp. BG0011]